MSVNSKEKVIFLKEEFADGEGTFKYQNRSKYEGQWKNGQRDGFFYSFYQYQVKIREDILKNDLEKFYNDYLRELKRKNFSVQYKIPIKSIIF